MSEWTTLVLGDSLDVLIDNRGKNPPYVERGVPTVSGQNVRSRGVLDLSDARTVSEETWRKWMPVATRQGDVVMTSEAPLGRVARVSTDDPLALTQRVFGLRGAEGVLDTGFLYYALQTKSTQLELEARATGTTVVGIRQPALRSLPLQAPPIGEQQAIAEVLGALDDKIAANATLVATAWACARAEFAAVQRNATDSLVLGDIASLEYGKALPQAAREEGTVHVVGSGGITGSHSTALVERSGVVVGRKGSAGAVHWITGAHFPIDTTFYVVGKDEIYSQAYLYFLLAGLPLSEMNNDSAVPGLNRAEALALPVRVPAPPFLREFDAAATRLIKLVEAVEAENRTLAATRDTVLPQLMSGKLRVCEVVS